MSHHSPGYSITVRLRYRDLPGSLGRITSMIGQQDGLIGAVDVVDTRENDIVRDVTISVSNVEHGERVVDGLRSIPEVEVVNVSDRVFLMHLGGKLEVTSRVQIKNRDDLSMAYTPGVARICKTIFEDPESAFSLTVRRNMVAVVSDGSAVLGMGNIGPAAAMPVMEGKAILFKEFGGVDAFPICLDTQDTKEIISIVKALGPTFGGITSKISRHLDASKLNGGWKQSLTSPSFTMINMALQLSFSRLCGTLSLSSGSRLSRSAL